MRIFVTGSTGFIGSAVVRELLNDGTPSARPHTLRRRSRGTDAAAGAEPHRGSLEDLESLRSEAASADGVIHLAFNHDFSKFAENCESDRRIIEALGIRAARRPTGRSSSPPEPPLRVQPRAKTARPSALEPTPRAASRKLARVIWTRGRTLRSCDSPQVHDPREQGLIFLRDSPRTGEGRFPVHRRRAKSLGGWHITDIARLYRLAIEARVPAEAFTMRSVRRA